jgi:hypothetical protein
MTLTRKSPRHAVGVPRQDRALGTLALPDMKRPMYQHIIGTGAVPYICLKGRAMDLFQCRKA